MRAGSIGGLTAPDSLTRSRIGRSRFDWARIDRVRVDRVRIDRIRRDGERGGGQSRTVARGVRGGRPRGVCGVEAREGSWWPGHKAGAGSLH